MTNMEATYRYRKFVNECIQRYSASLRVIFEKHGRPIPVTTACGAEMTVAWITLKTLFRMADEQLAIDR